MKLHTSEFYAIISKLEDTANKIYEDYPETEVTEEWVEEVAPDYMGRKVDHIEKIVIASKIWELQNQSTATSVDNKQAQQ